MQLLVSVRDSEDATAALAGGADLIDVKDPAKDALGAADIDQFREVMATIAGVCPVTAALGDAIDAEQAGAIAAQFASAGATFVKIGFKGINDVPRIHEMLTSIIRSLRSAGAETGVVAVAYAESVAAERIPLLTLIEAAACAGARGVLVDTMDKSGPGLRDLLPRGALMRWAEAAHDAQLLFSVAGRLTEHDIEFARSTGADIAGVRSAVCEGGRSGPVVVDRVRRLRALCSTSTLDAAQPSAL